MTPVSALLVAWLTEHALVAFGLWLWLHTSRMPASGPRSPVEPRLAPAPTPVAPPPEDRPEDVRTRLAGTVPGWANLSGERQAQVVNQVMEQARRALGR